MAQRKDWLKMERYHVSSCFWLIHEPKMDFMLFSKSILRNCNAFWLMIHISLSSYLLLFAPCVWRVDVILSSCTVSQGVYFSLPSYRLPVPSPCFPFSHEENLHYHIQQVFHDDFWFIVFSGPMVWTQGPILEKQALSQLSHSTSSVISKMFKFYISQITVYTGIWNP
jgi:hypothetical protein